ncbi:MAG: spermidine/putrescine ABC transporter substrate-binding protein [Tissierellia bacterium]|nr:spermidine/putrescine ABC transporter substrate-binding protein [Tissierellia bacterium]
MKKQWILPILLLFLCACSRRDGEVVYLYNWGEYLDPGIKEDFYRETGIKVIEDNFVQNEDMYMKISTNPTQYDLVIPSDYMVERLIKEDYLDTIDYSKLENFKYIHQDFQNMDYDPENKYTIPYFWGTVGIIYDPEMTGREINSWKDLFTEEFKDEIIMMDSMRDTIGVALLKNGYSMNSRDPEELEVARQDLIRQKEWVLAYLVDETKSLMVNKEAAIAVMYSGDAMIALDENPNLKYIVPEEGTNLWFDCLTLLKGGRNKDNAMKFIDYLLRPDVAAKNSRFVGYSTPNDKALEIMGDDFINNPVYHPDLTKIKHLETFRDPSDFIEDYEDIWADLKAAK